MYFSVNNSDAIKSDFLKSGNERAVFFIFSYVFNKSP